jgi:GT2 family glycosyltransferase
MKEMQLRASIVVGVYNRHDQILRCLESCIGMPEQNFELVIVDDASTDRTPESLQEFRAAHPEATFHSITSSVNLGAAGARNMGVRAARAPIVVFTDSDCTVDASWLTELLKLFQAEEVGVVGGPVIDVARSTLVERAYAGTCRTSGRVAENPVLVEGNLAIRRDLALSVPFDEAIDYGCEGNDVLSQIRKAGYRVAFAPAALVFHNHPMRLRDYLRNGLRQGKGSARFWYKHSIWIGRDLIALFLALLFLPLGLLGWKWLLIPAAFLCLQFLAVGFNEWILKGKPLREVAAIYPLCLLYYGARALGVVVIWLKLLFGGEKAIRASKRLYRNQHVAKKPTPAAPRGAAEVDG